MQVRDTNRNRRSLGVLALVCAFLQLAVASNIALGAGRANIALVFAALASLTIGGRAGVIAGFCAGLFFDLCTTGPVGLMALLLTAASYVMGGEERNRLTDEPAASLVVFAVTSLVVTLAYHMAMLLMGEQVSLVDALLMRTLPSYALTLLAFLAIGFFVSRGSGGSGGLGSGGSSGLGSGSSSTHLNISTGRHTRGGGFRLGRP